MIRVETGGRLHFGLLNPARVPGLRCFGGAGLMVQAPRLSVTVASAADWSASGPLAGRALDFARRARAELPADAPPAFAVSVEESPPEHAGLGVGTQLGLAVALACALEAGAERPSPERLARLAGRGLRSGLGVHGFFRGGFLVDGGKAGEEGLAPLVAAATFPEEWRLAVVLADDAPGRHGDAERGAFRRLASSAPAQTTDALCRLALLGMLPALAERDLRAFGEALTEFNRRAGEAFAAVQGGVYAGPRVAEAVEWLTRQGVAAAGQSSWGPAVFALVGDEDRAADLAGRVRERYGPAGRLWVTGARNVGATLHSNLLG